MILITLLTAVLISSLLAVYVLTMNSDDISHDGVVYVKNEKELTNTINNIAEKPITIALNKDLKLSSPLVISADKNITLTSNTKNNIKFYKLIGTNKQQPQETITVEDGAILRLDGITVTHTKGAGGRGIIVNSGGKLVMTNGKITGNNGRGIDGDDYCGGVVVYGNGYFEMTGGTITDNKAKGHVYGFGGGVYVAERGSFNMTGNAYITDNEAGDGGGVYVAEDAFFSMTGNAYITSNEAGAGGGVCVRGFFNMSGGKIIDNTASYGGGVREDTGGTFNMTGNAVIIGNTVRCDGGGVYVGSYFSRPGGTFYMKGNAIIANNTADSQSGGGVYVYNGQFEMSDGKITGNTANDGGGICNHGNITMTGGTITNNTAGTGGGVFNYNGPPKWTEVPVGSFVYSFFKMTGGEITNNTADNGGGIYDCLGTFNKIGGVIANNKASNVGNDICRPDDLNNKYG
jgi:hypothetical protein